MYSVIELKKMLGISENLEIDIVKVSPDVASKILENNNTSNRKLSEAYVKKFISRLKRGEFVLSTDNIGFSEEGVLVNGQHRLSAIARSGISATLGITFGVSQFMDMDTGRKRSFVDNASIFENFDGALRTEEGKQCLRVVRDCMQYITGRCVSVEKRYSSSDLVKVANFFAPELIDCSNEGLFKKKKGTNMPLPVMSAMFLAYINGVSFTILKHIKEVLETGIVLSDRDLPIISLRDHLFKIKGGGSVVGIMKYCLACSCIDKVDRGVKTKRLSKDKYLYVFEDIVDILEDSEV